MSARLEVGSLAPNPETDPAERPEAAPPAAAVLQGVRIGGNATIEVTQYLNAEPPSERVAVGGIRSQHPDTVTDAEWAPPGERGQGAPHPWVRSALRRDLSTFVGRDTELQRLVDAADPGQIVSIHAVDGMPGVGKTALVTRAAHMLADGFPDGRYFVEFNAHAAGLTPADPFHVLATLLTYLGVDPGRIPDTLAGRRDLWRDRLEGRRLLLVFDDVLDHTQIEPLLPPGHDSLVLVTSRRRLIGLDGATPLPLDSLDPDAAAQVFWNVAHRHPTGTDDAAVAQIVRLCGYLPLAIVLLAGRLAHHPAWSVADLAAELVTTHDRLSELEAGQRAVRAAFTTSYRTLSPQRQQMFRQLGLHPGPDLDVYAAAAVAEMPVAQARRHIDAIYIDHLIEETVPGRYRFHDLLREFARELADQDPVDDTDRAVDRLFDYYIHASRRVSRLSPTPPRQPATAGSYLEVPTSSSDVAALAWMRVERPNLLACLAHASAKNQLHHVVGLSGALADELRLHGFWQLGIVMSQRAKIAGHTISDSNAETLALKDLAPAGYLADGYLMAAELLHQQLAHHRHTDPTMKSVALQTLAKARLLAGDYPAAINTLEQALLIVRETRDRSSEGFVLINLGWVYHPGQRRCRPIALRTAETSWATRRLGCYADTGVWVTMKVLYA